MDALPFPRAHDESLQYDMFVLQHHITVRIFQIGVGQQELRIGVRHLLGDWFIPFAAGAPSEE
jgi:hypothetical protein